MLNLICMTCNMLLLGILLIGRQLCRLWSKTDGCRLDLQPKAHRDLDYPDLNDVYSKPGTCLRSNTWLDRVASHINRWTWACGDSMIQGGCLRLKFDGSQQHNAYVGDGLPFVSKLIASDQFCPPGSDVFLLHAAVGDNSRLSENNDRRVNLIQFCQHDNSSPC